MEKMGVKMIDRKFWKGKKVFITGNTGFKGTWLSLWLNDMGAKVYGYALSPNSTPSLFDLTDADNFTSTMISDIRDLNALKLAIQDCDPDIAIHMAAQPLVRDSYRDPVSTYETNVMGTVNFLEACRDRENLRVVLNVTTDKVYENREWCWGYREDEPFGGYDPYSNSKACSELVTASYRNSFFNVHDYGKLHQTAVASARAGNVIGGGDWAADRLIPDILKAFESGTEVILRNPHSTRPWQHVLEPLSGYLLLCQKLYGKQGSEYAEGWNFGPKDEDALEVELIVKKLCNLWGNQATYRVENKSQPHEANFLKLDCSKARSELNWKQSWNIDEVLFRIAEWQKEYNSGKSAETTCLNQIHAFEKAVAKS